MGFSANLHPPSSNNIGNYSCQPTSEHESEDDHIILVPCWDGDQFGTESQSDYCMAVNASLWSSFWWRMGRSEIRHSLESRWPHCHQLYYFFCNYILFFNEHYNIHYTVMIRTAKRDNLFAAFKPHSIYDGSLQLC